MTNRWQTPVWLLMTLALLASPAIGQPPPLPGDGPPSPFQLDLVPGLGQGDAGPKIFFDARFEVEEGTRTGRLHVTATPAKGWHTYSITQPKGGPLPSVLHLKKSADVRATGPFSADVAPHINREAFFEDPLTRKKPIPVEEHHEAVTWTAPIEFAEGVDVEKYAIEISYEGQACKESCILVEESFKASFAGFYKVATPTGEYEAETGHVTWTAHIEPQVATPGSKVNLIIRGTPVEPYHLYAYEVQNNKKGYMPTLIALRPLPAGWTQSAAKTTAPIIKRAATGSGSELQYHEGPVTWTIEIDVPKDAQPGQVDLSGLIGFQTCTDENCDFPGAAKFSVALPVGAASRAQPIVAFETADYGDAEKLARSTSGSVVQAQPAVEFSFVGLLFGIGAGFLGGLILNVMPCVLPVIPLKLLSFVEQAGQSQSKLMMYNLVYALGTIAVFLCLSVVSIVFGLGWGEQFAFTEFQIAVTLFMFAMTLSLLGVWEISLPTSMGSGEVVSAEASSGLMTAFGKGFMTTIYATPCSGPFLGAAIGATIGLPAFATLLIFAAAGLGFASPYIVFGLLMARYPSVTRFIPKPGVWMEHVKQGLGFLLLIVVLYYLCLIDTEYRIATLFAAVGVAFGCWLIGKVPPYAESRQKMTAWLGATASIALAGWVAFTWLGPTSKAELYEWQPYSAQALAEARSQGKTVMIDFTASWCPNCHWNFRTAINTSAVKQTVDKNDVVALMADWSDRGDAIKQKLLELNSKTIPVLAVYPADGGEPIVLRDIVVQSQVVDALEKAGPSKKSSDSAETTAMTRSNLK